MCRVRGLSGFPASRRSPPWCLWSPTFATIRGAMSAPLSSIPTPVLALGTEYYLFGAAGLLTVCAFVGLILVPAIGSYGRVWETLVAGFLSLFVLAALVLIGLVIGVVIFLNWDEISHWF